MFWGGGVADCNSLGVKGGGERVQMKKRLQWESLLLSHQLCWCGQQTFEYHSLLANKWQIQCCCIPI